MSVTTRRLCVYFPLNICHILVLKNRLLQLQPAGNPRCHTSSTIPGHQKLTTFELSLLETTESKQDMSGQTSWRVSRHFEGHATWEPQTNSLLRSSLTIQTLTHTHLLYTHTHAHTHSVTPYPRSSDFKRNKEIKQNELQTHQASHAL